MGRGEGRGSHAEARRRGGEDEEAKTSGQRAEKRNGGEGERGMGGGCDRGCCWRDVGIELVSTTPPAIYYGGTMGCVAGVGVPRIR